MRTEARNGAGKAGEAGGQERGAEQAVHRARVGVRGEAPGFPGNLLPSERSPGGLGTKQRRRGASV